MTLLLDMERRAVTFWAEGGQTATHEGLPKDRPLTAAISLYQNSAIVTGLRHVLPPKDEPKAPAPEAGAGKAMPTA